jgi:Bacteriophage minor capsid protein
MDVIKQISEYLTNNISLNAPIVSPVLSRVPQSVAIRETPSSIANRYLNTEKTMNFQFQLLVKDPSIIKARDTINAIFSRLDGMPKGTINSANDSFIITKCECTTLPNWVETTERNEHIFTAIFAAEIELGGN